MLWKKAEFKIPSETTTDELGNIIATEYESEYYDTREMGWIDNYAGGLKATINISNTVSQLLTTQKIRELLTEAPSSVCQSAQYVVWDNEDYEIVETYDYPRNRTLIYLKRFRNEN